MKKEIEVEVVVCEFYLTDEQRVFLQGFEDVCLQTTIANIISDKKLSDKEKTTMTFNSCMSHEAIIRGLTGKAKNERGEYLVVLQQEFVRMFYDILDAIDPKGVEYLANIKLELLPILLEQATASPTREERREIKYPYNLDPSALLNQKSENVEKSPEVEESSEEKITYNYFIKGKA